VFRRDDLCFLPRTEQHRRAMKMALALPQLINKLNVTSEEERFLAMTVDTALPTNLHISMFINTVEGQGTEEQKAYWLPKIINYEARAQRKVSLLLTLLLTLGHWHVRPDRVGPRHVHPWTRDLCGL